MKLLRRHKIVLLVLGIYWPFLFWLTHTPVRQIVKQSGVSDKMMHTLAYFALTFLIWFAINPYGKVSWAKAKAWFVVLAVALYGVTDEFLQARVGRSADTMDFIANLFGVLLALGLLSIIGFWSAMLMASAVFIFILSDISRLMALPEYAHYAAAFHFTAYTAFTLIWTQWLERFSKFIPGRADWLAVSALVPAGLLLLVKLMAPIWGRPLNIYHIAVAAFGIAAAVLASWSLFKFSRKSFPRD
ncbi:MAG: VanZ family protein [Planctomycetota bacterium]